MNKKDIKLMSESYKKIILKEWEEGNPTGLGMQLLGMSHQEVNDYVKKHKNWPKIEQYFAKTKWPGLIKKYEAAGMQPPDIQDYIDKNAQNIFDEYQSDSFNPPTPPDLGDYIKSIPYGQKAYEREQLTKFRSKPPEVQNKIIQNIIDANPGIDDNNIIINIPKYLNQYDSAAYTPGAAYSNALNRLGIPIAKDYKGIPGTDAKPSAEPSAEPSVSKITTPISKFNTSRIK